jgi:hypothetical protein
MIQKHSIPSPNPVAFGMSVLLMVALVQIARGQGDVPVSLQEMPTTGIVALYGMALGCLMVIGGSAFQVPSRFLSLRTRINGFWVEFFGSVLVGFGTVAYWLAIYLVNPVQGTLAGFSSACLTLMFCGRGIQIIRLVLRVGREADALRAKESLE